MSEKVVMSRNDFEKIQEIQKESPNEDIVWDHAHNDLPPLVHVTLDTLIRALYRPEDIIIEQTVEEQLLEKYQKAVYHVESEWSREECFQDGMYQVLKVLKMKVKGINE